MTKIIVLINALVFFFFFCHVFVKAWADGIKYYRASLNKKPVINISKKHQIVIMILFHCCPVKS
jgi:hypothetical protein